VRAVTSQYGWQSESVTGISISRLIADAFLSVRALLPWVTRALTARTPSAIQGIPILKVYFEQLNLIKSPECQPESMVCGRWFKTDTGNGGRTRIEGYRY